MEPSGFSVSEQDVVRNYLESGGKMFIGRELFRYLFPGDEGQRFVSSLLGPRPVGDRIAFRILHPNHPWLRHLDDNEWVNHPSMSPVGVSKGQNLIGETETSRSVLASIPVGRGQLIYCGWNLSRWQPSGRAESSLEQESAYDDQYRIYEEIVSDLLKESPVGG